MVDCWAELPSHRPSFESVLMRLEEQLVFNFDEDEDNDLDD